MRIQLRTVLLLILCTALTLTAGGPGKGQSGKSDKEGKKAGPEMKAGQEIEGKVQSGKETGRAAQSASACGYKHDADGGGCEGDSEEPEAVRGDGEKGGERAGENGGGATERHAL